MATKKLLVRTPQTKDGINLKYDSDNQPVYKQSIVELGARKQLDSINSTLPEHLRHQIMEVEVDDKGNLITEAPAPATEKTKKNAGKEEKKEE